MFLIKLIANNNTGAVEAYSQFVIFQFISAILDFAVSIANAIFFVAAVVKASCLLAAIVVVVGTVYAAELLLFAVDYTVVVIAKLLVNVDVGGLLKIVCRNHLLIFSI